MNIDTKELFRLMRREGLSYQEALKRLQGVEGPERSLVAQAAERAERQGGVEDSREGSRVAPGEAKAALRELLRVWESRAARIKRHSKVWEKRNDVMGQMACECAAATIRLMIHEVMALLPQPDSDAEELEISRRHADCVVENE